ncbi:hypothetical protein DRE_04241 [Drechslerella stenobrocha 248]|uniref:GSKIP domain-containing protein n=1 Tax=Drechslerella stenobrocha 248 TaxID=1043628 RepID=W7I2Z8_9PEZI|nr:hypothetical protein DRE_04241 [Drechslerella stenobrocha 248]
MPVDAPPIPAFAEDTSQLIKEYEGLVHKITADEANAGVVHVETKEHAVLTIELSSQGWKVLKVQPDDAPRQVKMLEGEGAYELPEGLLMAASDEFKRLWHMSLVEKLAALESFTNDEDEE